MVRVAAKGRPRYDRPFNSPLECGLRLLFVLAAADGHRCDLQRLISYDYLIVHSGDVLGGPKSLHPAVPYRSSELLVKRDLIQTGLNQMFSRELLSKNFDKFGITYNSTNLTVAFLGLLNTAYAELLRERAGWLISKFQNLDDLLLERYMAENIGRWGAEFERITAISGLEL
ncbi:ABC-three component system middle component 2 [Methylobacterium thuringiense]|uniref:ABC-three component system middle component 2 n=1 Tax=Methylobacterium thuringiense TaxID=1003091 RepID=UPI0027952734|nr:ABC-three component system middle component 2 [Methylobacterium thuringiense]